MKPANLILYVLLVLLSINCGQKSTSCMSPVVPDPFDNPDDNRSETGYVNLVLVHAETENPIANWRIIFNSGDSTTNEMGEVSYSEPMRVPKDYADISYKHPINFRIWCGMQNSNRSSEIEMVKP